MPVDNDVMFGVQIKFQPVFPVQPHRHELSPPFTAPADAELFRLSAALDSSKNSSRLTSSLNSDMALSSARSKSHWTNSSPITLPSSVKRSTVRSNATLASAKSSWAAVSPEQRSRASDSGYAFRARSFAMKAGSASFDQRLRRVSCRSRSEKNLFILSRLWFSISMASSCRSPRS